MKAIVAVDLNWGIGYQGNLLQPIPEDLQFFKKTTWGKVVIMGRETFESLPGQEPLKNRTNIVLTKNKEWQKDNVQVCHSIAELLKEVAKYKEEDLFVIGGETIYLQLLPYCDEVYLTKIEQAYIADKFFPNLDEDSEWEMVEQGEKKYYQEIPFSFLRYKRKA